MLFTLLLLTGLFYFLPGLLLHARLRHRGLTLPVCLGLGLAGLIVIDVWLASLVGYRFILQLAANLLVVGGAGWWARGQLRDWLAWARTQWPWPVLGWLAVAAIFLVPAFVINLPFDTDAQGFGFLALTVRLSGSIPPGARTLRWTYAPEYGGSVLRLRRAGASEVIAAWVREGEASATYPLAGDVAGATRSAVFGQYLVLGFTHILPKGLDHMLFVLGLFLLSTRLSPLLWQVTAFTLAHSITLALSMYGVIELSPAIVEPLIAASIVAVAVENLLTARLHAWRIFVVFGFGLLHGLGFAGVLTEIGLPRDEFVTGLIAFNVGVEGGQLAVIALAFLTVGYWFRHESWYRARVVLPLSALIALTGAYWMVERLWA